MENQKDKKKKKVLMPFGLRNKLMAAISMLLVSSIMLVSSTYAWFTLSTAPEVKGISTSVGANGNLEMALLTSGNGTDESTNTFKNLDKITSAVGDSSAAAGKTLATANLTWGNVVDLSYSADGNNNYYGLDQIKLMPARLNNGTGDAFDSKKLVLANPLSTPTYGNDGRVNDLSGKTYFSADYGTEGFKYVADKDTYGVRAVGESATLSPQQKGLMAAKISYDANMTLAQRTMQESLAANMQELANAMLTLATGTGSLEKAQTDAIDALLVDMGTALDKIDMAYGDVARAYIASQVGDAAKYNTLAETVAGKTYSQIAGMTLEGVTLPTGNDNALAAAVGELNTQKNNLKAAKDAVAGATKDYATAMKQLVNTDEVKLNGLSLKKDEANIDGTVWAKDGDNWTVDKAKLSDKVLNEYKGGIEVEMLDDSGLFAYIGKVAGNYSASDKIEVIFGEFKFTKNADGTGGIQATLKTNAAPDTTVKTGYLDNLFAANATNTTNYITDTYGYIIDLAVRTNATNSNLLLASDGVQRVYNDGEVTNEQTMGAGSTMTFKAVKDKDNNDVLSEAQVSGLMKTIRVVFFDPDKGTIHGIAAIDSVTNAGDEGYTGKLVLKNYEISEKGVMTLTARTADTDKLMDLQQNTATKISVLVYLDGDMVDNSMVANAASSITGSLNLQFKSSAELKPMENSTLRNGTTATNP